MKTRETEALTVLLRRVTQCTLLAAGLSLGAAVHAEIYESEGEDGTPSFSDIPTADSHEVKLHQENIADPVQSIPALESEEPAPHKSSHRDQGTDSVSVETRPGYVVDDYDEGRREVLDAGRRDEVLDAGRRDEVLDAGRRNEELDAGRRNEELDAGQRNEVLDATPMREAPRQR